MGRQRPFLDPVPGGADFFEDHPMSALFQHLFDPMGLPESQRAASCPDDECLHVFNLPDFEGDWEVPNAVRPNQRPVDGCPSPSLCPPPFF